MKNNLQNLIIYLAISVLVITLIFTFSYAYFVGNTVNDASLNQNLTFSEGSSFSANGTFTSNVVISEVDMFESEENKVVYEDNSTILISLEGNESCTYDVVWKWSNYDNYVATKEGEFVVSVSSSTNGAPTFDVNVPDYNASSNVLASGSITSTGTKVTQEMNINVKFYNLIDTDQSTHAGKNYVGSIKIENVDCK